MIKINNFVILLLFLSINLCAIGKSESQKQGEFRKYGIEIFPITLNGTISYDYIYVDLNTILLFGGKNIVRINTLSNEQEIIKPPEDIEDEYIYGFKKPLYDVETNSVHILIRLRLADSSQQQLYYILQLDDYSWENINELGNSITDYWYDSINKLIYFQGMNEVILGNICRLLVFDFKKKSIVEIIELPRKTINIYCMYNNPIKILATCRNSNNSFYFYVYNAESKIVENFSNININNSNELFILNDYVPLDNNCFLGVDKRKSDMSNITLFDLSTSIMHSVALENFPYDIYRFKKINNKCYSFIVATRNRIGGHGQQYLCYIKLNQY
jgi:hypothetical protein